MSYILGGIFLYFLYRFIVGFVWPVYKATSQVKRQFQDMKSKQKADVNSDHFNSESYSEKPKFDVGGDYIPFEDIKEK